MDQEPEGQPPEQRPYIRQLGCGCTLPGTGLVLLALTSILAALIATRTEGFSPLWLTLIPLILGILALFVRVRLSNEP